MTAAMKLLGLAAVALACWAQTNEAASDPLRGMPTRKLVASVDVTPDTLRLQVGDVGRATCTPKNTFGTVLTNTCAWVSRNTAIATTSTGTQNASVTALKAGQTRVAATVKGKTDSTIIIVTDTTAAPPPPPPADTTPAPPPPPPPVGGLPTPLRTVNVASSAALKAAIESALPGDRIVMAAGSYTLGLYNGPTRSGTAQNPIVLTGPRSAVMTGTTLLPNASYWILNGFRITQTDKNGIMHVGGNYNIYEHLEIDHVGTAGIAIKTALPASPSSTKTVTGNVVRYNLIHDTGTMTTWGEGIYLGDGTVSQRARNTHVHHNTIGPNIGLSSNSEAIEAKQLADSNRIEFNTVIGSYIQIRSDHNVINDNTLSGAARDDNKGSNGNALIGVATDIPGDPSTNNILRRNRGSNENYLFFVYDAGNKVYCDNVATAPTTWGGFSAAPCVP